MTLAEFIEFGATNAVLVTAIVESLKYGFLKGWFATLADKNDWDAATADKWYVRTLVVVSIAAGCLVALGAGAKANILTQLGYDQVSPVIGILLTGILLGFGNKFWHALFDLLLTLPTYGKVKIEAVSQEVFLKAPAGRSLPRETK